MDASALTTLVPAGGLGAVLLILVGYLLRQIPADRAEYSKAIRAERARTADANKRLDLAQDQIDRERQLRRAADTAAAIAESKLASQEAMLQWYATERTHLLRLIPKAVPPGVIPETEP